MNRCLIVILYLTALSGLLADSGSISAADESPSVHFLTPQEILGTVWNHFLGAMSSGSDNAVRSECTRAGYQSLVTKANDKEPRGVQWRRWGQGWSRWGPVQWRSITSDIAYGKLGPKGKEASVNFVLTPRGWKLDQWSPPE